MASGAVAGHATTFKDGGKLLWKSFCTVLNVAVEVTDGLPAKGALAGLKTVIELANVCNPRVLVYSVLMLSKAVQDNKASIKTILQRIDDLLHKISDSSYDVSAEWRSKFIA